MWIELLGTTFASIGGVALYVKNRKKHQMPAKEKRSITNIQQVLENFNEGKLQFRRVTKPRYNYFTYQKKNFTIKIYAYPKETSVALLDNEFDGDGVFFRFEYENETKELIKVEETSNYYKRYGHYENNRDLLKSFMKNIMRIDWVNYVQEEQLKLKAIYSFEHETPFIESVVNEHAVPIYSGNKTIRLFMEPYLAHYQLIQSQGEKLDVEELHIVERDYKYIQQLCSSFEALRPSEQINEIHTLKQRIDEKTQALEETVQKLQSQVLHEFKKINEVLKADNRI